MSVDVINMSLTSVKTTQPARGPVDASNGSNSHIESLAQTHLQETMIAISIEGTSYAVMLATPDDLEDFARGFALSEVLVQHADEIRDIGITRHDQGITLDLALSSRARHAAKERRRLMAGSTGCGLCGADAIAYALASEPGAPAGISACAPSSAAIHRARNALGTQQRKNREAGGGMHAAALFDIEGDILAVREDIGRHNALDKLIGASSLVGTNSNAALSNNYAMLTSRCSYELVLKCARAGIGMLVTFAVPTTLAVQCAQRANIALACYQGPQLLFYHGN